jgi:hypothetical protein
LHYFGKKSNYFLTPLSHAFLPPFIGQALAGGVQGGTFEEDSEGVSATVIPVVRSARCGKI